MVMELQLSAAQSSTLLSAFYPGCAAHQSAVTAAMLPIAGAALAALAAAETSTAVPSYSQLCPQGGI